VASAHKRQVRGAPAEISLTCVRRELEVGGRLAQGDYSLESRRVVGPRELRGGRRHLLVWNADIPTDPLGTARRLAGQPQQFRGGCPERGLAAEGEEHRSGVHLALLGFCARFCSWFLGKKNPLEIGGKRKGNERGGG
jgi:hypothetical protein